MKLRKKIAVFLPSLQGGGAERLIFEELDFMKEDPRFLFEVHLLFEKGPLYLKFMELGIPIRTWNAPHDSLLMFRTCYDFSRYLQASSFDILHCHLLNTLGPVAGILAGVRTITTVHGDVFYNTFQRFFLKRNNLVLGCGRQVFKNISQFIPTYKTGLLSNGISIRKSRHEKGHVFEQLSIKPGSPLILSIGRLTRQKAYDVLIHAFLTVVNKHPDAVLVICGAGEDKELLERAITELKLEGHVLLTGWIDNVDEVLASCDIYVNTSRWEGLPLTLLEAMAHKKAIVATKVSGNIEVIIDGKTGMLVPPDDSMAIAVAISELLDDAPLREKLGAGAKELFEKEYTVNKHCDILASYYLTLH